MAKKKFKSFSDLHKYLDEQIKKSLKDEVAEVIKDEIQSSISEEVYYTYDPTVYERRGFKNGGLGDKDTMIVKLSNNGFIKVTSNAERNPEYEFEGYGYDIHKSLAENIIKGYGNRSKRWNKPRDFLEETRKNLKENKNHVEALKDSLENKGIKIKFYKKI